MKTIIYSLDTLDAVVEEIYSLLNTSSVFTFSGNLGAGKTTFIKRLLLRCQVEGLVTSPTFTYVVNYTNKQGQSFYHYDLYRINQQAEFLRAGLDEFLYVPHSWSFIEWPEIIMPLLTQKACYITLEYHGEHERMLRYSFSTDINNI
ncbi:tRNA (adenosine(37)-N6)-threonylcarbamoyltransferase complex ATPase subunit type 1 TsaE [Candidatus Dependentiae bacterium]|nr:tRNA (adenosine(37)-N6)-threonylcarbamoyltransferase complex ATPase subunit type 1 TsaE [Candidatus Dependentiae bacterium]